MSLEDVYKRFFREFIVFKNLRENGGKKSRVFIFGLFENLSVYLMGLIVSSTARMVCLLVPKTMYWFTFA
jgi:hypothetical protein